MERMRLMMSIIKMIGQARELIARARKRSSRSEVADGF